MSYQNPPTSIDEDEETAVPFVTTLTPATPTTVDHRSPKRMIAITLGMLLLVVAGVAVALFETPNGDRTTTTAEGLVVATEGRGPCVPATGHFHGLSTTAGFGESDPFQTCYKYGSYEKYCWTNAYYFDAPFRTIWYQCRPNGDDWYGIRDTKLPLSLCPTPCQDQHRASPWYHG
jgi:hypothetical protein